MYDKPRFQPHFSTYIIDDEKAVFLISEHGHFVLKGKLYCLLAPLLNGEHSLDDIIDLLSDQVSIAEIYYALSVMEKKGYITEAENRYPIEQQAFWSALGVGPKTAGDKLGKSSVSIMSLGKQEAAPLQSILQDLQIQTTEEAQLTIVLVDDYLQLELEELNQRFLEKKQSWIPVKAGGTVSWMGPLFVPGKTGCWQCLAQRLHFNRDVEEYIQQKNAHQISPSGVSIAGLPMTKQVVWNMLAVEIAKLLLTGSSLFSASKMLSLDMQSMKMEEHTLVKRPQCHVCGQTLDIHRLPEIPIIHSTKKHFTADGGHRRIAPEETLLKFSHHISPITGVVKYLRNAAQNDKFLKVYHSGHNFAVQYHNLDFLKQGLRSQSAGKGMTEAQARAGALCEAIERYSGVFRGDEARLRSTFRELGEKAIHPNSIMNYSEQQYRERETLNARKEKFHFVPEPFDETRLIDWTPVWSFTRQEYRYLPTAFCYYDYPGLKDVLPCSNGNASGNILEEAILQGFFELAERDAVALWWYNMLNMPGVDLDSFNEPYINEMLRYYHQKNREIWVLDLTSDLEIPSFVALSRFTGANKERIMMGFGAHFEARVALMRALTELNQMMPMILKYDDNLGEEIGDNFLLRWLNDASVANQAYLLANKNIPLRIAQDYKDLSTDDFLTDIEICRKIIEDRGMEMMVLDQTRPDIGMPVVKVIVPGLRHFWERFAPGRLYDIPVQMGWLSKPRQEAEMNPIGIFL